MTKKKEEGYRELIDFICKGFNIKKPTGMQLKQISKMHKDYNYTYGGIKATIYYVTCIKNIQLENMSLGLVPYYYEEAKQHFTIQDSLRNKAKDICIVPVIIETGEISRPKRDKTKFIDISKIF